MENDKNKKYENEDVGVIKQSKFLPAYQRKNIKNNDEKVDRINKQKNKKIIFKSKISVILIALTLVVCVFVGFVIFSNKSEISDYDNLMEMYGFSNLYNNKNGKSNDNVTKSEIIKIVLASYLNVDDITDKMIDYKSEEELEYENQNWIDYAKSIEFIGENEITSENENDNITYIEAIRYIANAKVKILGKTLDIDKEVRYKDYEGYTTEQKWAISDLVYNEILDNKNTKLNGNKKITKSQYNEMIIRSILKYNLITLDNDKINIKIYKMPKNKNDYPYTLSSVDKTIYEIDFVKVNDGFKTPIRIYSNVKSYYADIDKLIEDYLNLIFNIDYETINTKRFKSIIFDSTMYYADSTKINGYLDYVQTNKIKISGESVLQLPIIYFDGEKYRARVKIKYNVNSANELKNLIYGDNENIEYKVGENTIYIDIPFYISEDSSTIYLKNLNLNDFIVKK